MEPTESDIGKVVQYYADGLRAGVLEELHGSKVKIRPIVGRWTSEKPHLITVNTEDVVGIVEKH